MTIQTLKSTYSPGDGLEDIQSDDLAVLAQFIKNWRGIGLRLRKGALGFGSSLDMVVNTTQLEVAGGSLNIKDGGLVNDHFADGVVNSGKTVGPTIHSHGFDQPPPNDEVVWSWVNGMLDEVAGGHVHP